MTKADKTDIIVQNFDIEIASDGRWYHEGGEIKRTRLVKLFASVLSCDEAGRYWLTTPVEKGEIKVADAPFVIVSLRVEGSGSSQEIYLTDNLDTEYHLGKQTPLEMRLKQGEAKPYLVLDRGLCALVKHAVYYEMAELALAACDDEIDDADLASLGVWSDGMKHALMPNEPLEDEPK